MIIEGQSQLQPPNPQPVPTVNFTATQVVVQVGDKFFGIPREALQRHRHSLFEQVLQQFEQAQKAGQSGVVTIVRNPTHFPLILTYLTHGLTRLTLRDVDLEVLEHLLIEAEFYQLPELCGFVKAQLKPELSREVVQHLLKRPTAPRNFTGARLVGLDLSGLNFVSVEVKGILFLPFSVLPPAF